MKIDNKGYTLSTARELLKKWEQMLQKKYGSDFYIKPEGVIDNVALSAVMMELLLQNQIAFLAKQFDPETAEAYWQDALYERIGVKRLDESPTVFKKKLKGNSGYTGSAGSITIRSSVSNEEFTNSESYTIGEDGTAEIEFESVIKGEIPVNTGERFVIVEAPKEIKELTEEEASEIVIGRDRESDSEFRVRFRNSKSRNARATRNANITNLLPYVDAPGYLRIYDRKTDNTIPVGTLKIIAKHNTTDEEFAKAIFETVVDGVAFIGDTSVEVKDSEGQVVEISWKNAEEVGIDITGKIKIKSGYYPNTVMTKVKESIIEYIEKRVYGLESTIYATEFIIPMLETDGVEAVTEVEVKKSTDNTFTDSVALTREEVPSFATDSITLINVTT